MLTNTRTNFFFWKKITAWLCVLGAYSFECFILHTKVHFEPDLLINPILVVEEGGLGVFEILMNYKIVKPDF